MNLFFSSLQALIGSFFFKSLSYSVPSQEVNPVEYFGPITINILRQRSPLHLLSSPTVTFMVTNVSFYTFAVISV